MPVPVFDTKIHIKNYIPRRRRKPFWIAWLDGISSQLDRLNLIFNDFRKGSTDMGYWSSIITYSVGNRVRTLFGIFESIEKFDSSGNLIPNINNNPITDDGTNWIKVLNDFMGADKRISFTVQKLSLEYALNERFQGVLTDNGFIGFKQPTSIDAGVGYLPLSDIYITYAVIAGTSFLSFDTESGSSVSFDNGSTGFVFDTPVYTFFTTYSANINIPLSVFSALGTPDVASSIIMNFVNKLKREGTFYNIVTY